MNDVNDTPVVGPEEEERIRADVRRKLEEKLQRQERQRLETRMAREEEKKAKEVARIRHDEEVRFYTEQGYVSSTRALDDTLDWYKPEDASPKKRRRRRSSKRRSKRNNKGFFRKHLRDILFVAVAVAGVIALFIMAN